MKVVFDKDNFTISSTLKNTPRINGVFFRKIKDKVLGESYDLSLIFVGVKKIKELNTKYRDKKYATDVLSFPLDKNSGEIFINLDIANKKSKEFDRTSSNYLSFLFIHSLLHLKGFDHGSRMEEKEVEIRNIFGV